jgi:peptidoglycan hydrolase CwlO-like protein
MKPLYIILTQSNTGAVILILALLLVAGIIGYFTAWYYAKSVYTPVIKGLEADKVELNRQIAGLKDDIGKLNGKVDKLNEKINKLDEEIAEKDKEIKHLNKSKK